MAIGSMTINVGMASGASGAFDRTSSDLRVCFITATDVNNPLSYVRVSGDAVSAAAGEVRINFTEGCLPEWPVYIRWINRLGGFEFHMFKGKKEYSEDVDRGDDYILAGASELGATATRGQLGAEVTREISCGDEGLNFDMWKFLKGVALSPQVWIYDTLRAEFVQATLKDTSIEWDTGNMTGSIDLDLRLIDEDFQLA